MLRPRYPLQFLIALLTAFLLWYALAAERSQNISVRGVKAHLTLVNIPRDLVLTSSVPDTISVQLRGPLSRALDSRNPPEVLLDLSDARPGLNSYPINERDIPLPPEVDVVSVDPPAITLKLERQETRPVTVRPTIEGVPAQGFVLGDVKVTPPQVTVQGPESLLLSLEFVGTTPISVEGAAGPIETSVEPDLPDPLLRVLGVGQILVTIDVAPEPATDAEAETSNEGGRSRATGESS
jgi:YbbR domain-containing protein